MIPSLSDNLHYFLYPLESPSLILQLLLRLPLLWKLCFMFQIYQFHLFGSFQVHYLLSLIFLLWFPVINSITFLLFSFIIIFPEYFWSVFRAWLFYHELFFDWLAYFLFVLFLNFVFELYFLMIFNPFDFQILVNGQ